jgi:F420-dependent oxidoreductase-like protein
VKVGLQIMNFNFPGGPENLAASLAEIARTADEVGFDSIWVMDHLFQMDYAPMGLTADEPMLDSYTALSYIAAVTSRARLGAMVTGVTYRQPGHLVKIVSNLDVLSGGRAYLGIGAGWYEREARGLGLPFPPLRERFERLEESLQIAHQMWSGEVRPFEGKHYQLAEPINNPMPLTRPHPPILIGGTGERRTLRLVAQYGNACNFFDFIGRDEISRKLDVLKGHCEDIGRPYESIERTALGSVTVAEGAVAVPELTSHCRDLADAGIQHFIFNLNEYRPATVEKLGRELIPAVSGL